MTENIFEPVPTPFNFSAAEKEINKFWKENRVYRKSLEARKDRDRFIFYEGPPTANGLPHPGHCLTRTIKDIFPRYMTMTGHYCERKAGWDTHGLPVEVEVCKELGILEGGKAAIEAYGVEKFNRACIESVFRYQKEWEELTDRIGFWVDLDAAYVTYHQSYVESVWWALGQLFDRGLLYQGHKVVWWWAQGGTALSAGEVGEGYRDIDDPAITVRLPLTEESKARFSLQGKPVSLLVWTTTPWTLLSNCAATVGAAIDYALVKVTHESSEEYFILAKAVVERYFGESATLVDEFLGDALIGATYQPLFNYGAPTQIESDAPAMKYWQVIAGDFVDIETGTGIVHTAPAFGEDDYRVCKDRGIGFLCYVKPDGTFDARVTDADPFDNKPFAGQFCKEADKGIIRLLKQRGMILKHDTYRHPYPFSPRSDKDPLIQYARRSWFIRTSEFIPDFLANNAKIKWQPEHIRDGRFGNFLANNVDWALSRERFWGTPLPVWVCEKTGHMEVICSYAELLAKPEVRGTEVWDAAKKATPSLSEHLKVHKPYIDAVTYRSPKDESARMRRVPEVIDVWFDAGSMPFAQWGYPHVKGSEALLWDRFPADFISEAIDQTRGWFYAMLAISTMLFGKKEGGLRDRRDQRDYPHPFRSCICLGHILGEDGTKLSKRLKNYSEPAILFDKFSADALRWSFIAKNPPTSSSRLSEKIVEEAQRELLVRWSNVYSFFVIYANLDGFDPSGAPVEFLAGITTGTASAGSSAKAPYSPRETRSELDRWILDSLDRTTISVRRHMHNDRLESFLAARVISSFLDGLSNWYVRRSRPRFWASEWTQDKADAYWTLYECLLTFARLAAPFTPFFAESTWRNLVRPLPDAFESVHLSEYPKSKSRVSRLDWDLLEQMDVTRQAVNLLEQMDVTRQAVNLGLSARRGANIKVRQPLRACSIVLSKPSLRPGLEAHADIIREELNLKHVDFGVDPQLFVNYEIKPNFKLLGPKLGKKLKAFSAVLASVDGALLYNRLQAEGKASFEVEGSVIELSSDELNVRLLPKEGWAAAQGPDMVVVISTEITDELRREGWARDLVRTVQDVRKDKRLAYDAQIAVTVFSTHRPFCEAIQEFHEYVQRETLAKTLDVKEGGCDPSEVPLSISLDDFLFFARVTPL